MVQERKQLLRILDAELKEQWYFHKVSLRPMLVELEGGRGGKRAASHIRHVKFQQPVKQGSDKDWAA